MILKNTLERLVESQKEMSESFDYGITRTKLEEIDTKPPQAVVLSGIRRCGKSTLLHQIMRRLEGGYFLNFEDPRLVDFEVSDFEKLKDVFSDVYGSKDYYFLDEIQNVDKWEIFVRAELDAGKKFVITGSNASLLSKELGTKLTGRHIRYELFPFSYSEFLRFENRKKGLKSFKKYFRNGGFPEYLKYEKQEILRELLNDIIARDIIVRHGLRSGKTVKELAVYLLSNIGKEFSYNSLKETFNVGSVNTIISFISYLEDSYLFFTVPRFSYSLKKQSVSNKKIYCIDNGFLNANSASFSENLGRALENMVFLNLRKKYKEIFYFKESGECDFVVKERTKIRAAYQVCFELNQDNKEREISGLLEALKKFKLNKGFILTFEQEDSLEVDGKTIEVVPVWKWLLKDSQTNDKT